MAVYFVQASSGPIKIGSAANSHKRLISLRIANHEDLTLIAVIDGNEIRERELQYEFRALRIRGEWFEPGAALLDFIQKNHPQPVQPWTKTAPNRGRPAAQYGFLIDAETGETFKAPRDPGRDYTRNNVVPHEEAEFLKAAYSRIVRENPDSWPSWWLIYLRDAARSAA